jgi:hypothetical protein
VNWFSAFEEKEIMKEMDRKFGQRETNRVKRSASKSSSLSSSSSASSSSDQLDQLVTSLSLLKQSYAMQEFHVDRHSVSQSCFCIRCFSVSTNLFLHLLPT